MIIAGPCSINNQNCDILNDITQLKADGVRVVGLKSRTSLTNLSEDMGIDLETYNYNKKIFLNSHSTENLKIYPSIVIANNLIQKYPEIIVATEIVDPLIQLPVWEKHFKGKLLIWNPSINQLGWDIETMSQYLERNSNWYMGIKNGKWLGKTGEKTWKGLISYIPENIKERCFLIHRGFDTERNFLTKRFRNIPKHNIALKIKKESGLKLLYDPSHSLGKDLRDRIVEDSKNNLKRGYDGLLIEVGDSTTDREQHITLEELKNILN